MEKLAKRQKRQERKHEKKAKKAKKLAKQAVKEERVARSRDQSRPSDDAVDVGEMEDVSKAVDSETIAEPTGDQIRAPLAIRVTRKSPKSGPTTSAYFAKSAPGVVEEQSHITGSTVGGQQLSARSLTRKIKRERTLELRRANASKSAITEAVEEQHIVIETVVEGPKPSARSRGRKRKREPERGDASDLVKLGRETSQIAHQAVLDKDVTAIALEAGPVFESQYGQAPVDGTLRHKRRRKRNKNRLAATAPIEVLGGLVAQVPRYSPMANNTDEDDLSKKADMANIIDQNKTSDMTSSPQRDEKAPELKPTATDKITRNSTLIAPITTTNYAKPLISEDVTGQQLKRRDRGRGRNLNYAKDNAAPSEPLTELDNTNSKSPRIQVSDAGTKHSRIRKQQGLKAHHS